MTSSREQWLDIMKGLAILLVVIGHMLRGFTAAGLHPESQDYFDYIDFTIYNFHMPLFFMLSGYLYSRNEQLNTLAAYPDFVLKKLVRLGIPYIIFSLIQGSIRLCMSGHTNQAITGSTLLSIWYEPFDQFWFLYALFIIFLIVPLLERLVKNTPFIFLSLLLLEITAPLIRTEIPMIDLFVANVFYFYCGSLLLRVSGGQPFQTPVLIGGSMLYLFFNLLFYSRPNVPWILSELLAPSFLASTGIIFSLTVTRFLLLKVNALKTLFNWLGLYSFEIFLIHSMVSASARIALSKIFHTDDLMLHVIFGLGLGILIPILVSLAAKKWPPLEFTFYPGKYIRFRKKQVSPALGT